MYACVYAGMHQPTFLDTGAQPRTRLIMLGCMHAEKIVSTHTHPCMTTDVLGDINMINKANILASTHIPVQSTHNWHNIQRKKKTLIRAERSKQDAAASDALTQ